MDYVWLFVVLGTLAVVFAYVLVRVASVAYFRTRAEHLRSTLRHLKGEDEDGEV